MVIPSYDSYDTSWLVSDGWASCQDGNEQLTLVLDRYCLCLHKVSQEAGTKMQKVITRFEWFIMMDGVPITLHFRYPIAHCTNDLLSLPQATGNIFCFFM